MDFLIGEGAYGKVFLKKKNGKDLAIKKVKNSKKNGIKIIPEINFLSFFFKKSPYLVSMKEIKIKKDEIKIYFNKSDLVLRDYIENNNINIDEIKKIIFEILLGLKVIHDSNIIHQDIKPENILLFKNGKEYQSQICDYGICYYNDNFLNNVDIASTPFYRAPEIYTGIYDCKIDIWSLGCIFYELMTKDCLMKNLKKCDNKEILKSIYEILPEKCYPNEKIRKRDLEFFNSKLDKKNFNIGEENCAYDIIIKMLKIDPKERLSVNECINHKFFNDLIIIKEKSLKLNKIPKLKEFKIKQIDERKIMVNEIKKIFNRKEDLVWYNERILFQTISLYDAFLIMNNEKNLSDNDYLIIFNTCLFISSKNYALLIPIEIKYFGEMSKEILKWEKKIVFEIFNGYTFFNNPYEILQKDNLIKGSIYELLKIYLSSEVNKIQDVIHKF